MKVEVLGDGSPEYAVLSCIHGDEPCGWKAIQRFKNSDYPLKKPVKVVLANEEAFEKGERFIDVDLNRVFPGDSEADSYEERLAAKIQEELEGLKILDIHSTESREAPFAIISGDNGAEVKLVRSTGLEKAADFSSFDGGVGTELEVVSVELSRTTGKPTEDAYEVLLNFLGAEGVIEGDYSISDPNVFVVEEKVEGSGYKFLAKNFQKVEKGEVFARKENDELVAEEEFYPVLMSTKGYKDMVGFKAEKKD